MPRRVAAVISVAAGLALIGASAGGVLALDSELRAASQTVVPSRLTEDRAPWDGRCREPHPAESRSPEV